MWKKVWFLFPFVNVKFVCLAFCMSDAIFIVKPFDRLCVSVHPWGHGEGGGGFVDPPKQLQTLLTPPLQLQHLLPSLAHRAEKDIASWSSQVDKPFSKTSVLESFLNAKFDVKLLQEPRTAPPGWVLTIYNSVHRLDGGLTSATSAPWCSRDLMSNAVQDNLLFEFEHCSWKSWSTTDALALLQISNLEGSVKWFCTAKGFRTTHHKYKVMQFRTMLY